MHVWQSARVSERASGNTRDASATAATADMQFRASAPPHITQLRSLFTRQSGFGGGPAVAGDAAVPPSTLELEQGNTRVR